MITNTLENPSEFDALIKLRLNEPYFALTGSDPKAPVLVREWARMEREFVHLNIEDRPEAERRLRKATDAEFISFEMDVYRRGEEAKASEAGPETSYSGHKMPPEAQRRDDENRARLRASKHLSEAAAQVQSALELVTGIDSIAEIQLAEFRDYLTEASHQVAPVRPVPK